MKCHAGQRKLSAYSPAVLLEPGLVTRLGDHTMDMSHGVPRAFGGPTYELACRAPRRGGKRYGPLGPGAEAGPQLKSTGSCNWSLPPEKDLKNFELGTSPEAGAPLTWVYISLPRSREKKMVTYFRTFS